MPSRQVVLNLGGSAVLHFSLSAADKKSKDAKADEAASLPTNCRNPRPRIWTYTMYQRIRDEGLAHSHVMEFASALMDGIGPRLTGSPNLKRANEWTRDQLAAMGCSNAHLEDWGEFGMGWRQLNTWVRMSAPDTAVFIAQALPWSPSSNGPISGRAVWVDAKDEKDLEKYKGKLAGKIVFFGEMREVKPVDKPLFERRDDANLKQTRRISGPCWRAGGSFPGVHQAAGIPREGGTVLCRRACGGDRGSEPRWPQQRRIRAERSSTTAERAWDGSRISASTPSRLPIVVMAIENYGRVYRLLKANVPVTVEMDVETEFTGDHEHGFDTIAEIPGTDPKLKDEVVMVGGHLDSWASATGATDNGAGTVVAMEVMRILNALHVQPRRTIRVGLWTGEEQGEFGSYGYVKQHFGFVPLSTAPDQVKLPDFLRKPAGPVELKPEQQKISGYFNRRQRLGKDSRHLSAGERCGRRLSSSSGWRRCRISASARMTMRNTGGTDHEAFDSVGVPGIPVHSGHARLRIAHASLQHGYLRAAAAR